MKITLLTFIATSVLYSFSYGQTVKELFKEKNYRESIKLESKAAQFNAEELYLIGYSFFRLENDQKAIEFYDKAIAKGLDTDETRWTNLNNGTIWHFSKEKIKADLINIEEVSNYKLFFNEKGIRYVGFGY